VPEITAGDGPECATLQQAVRTVVGDATLWTASTDGSGWVKPLFTPALSGEHQTRWKTIGTLILVHLLTLGNGPEPISPFLLYLLLTAASHHGHRSLCAEDVLIDLGSLYELDRGTADILRPWMVLKETDKLSGFSSGQVPRPLMSVQGILSMREFQVRFTHDPLELLP
jgi:hypothetical protein